MNKFTLCLLAGAIAPAALAFSFDDIEFWVGSGSNRAALVIDWNDGPSPQSLAWGYRFDGAATGQAMFESVAAADPRLFLTTATASFGTYITAIGYDRDGNGSLGTGDSYFEGFGNSYWGYWVNDGGTAFPGSNWESSNFGFGDRNLVDGSWDGWAVVPAWPGAAPRTPEAAPVPEPATLAALGFGVVWLARRRKRA